MKIMGLVIIGMVLLSSLLLIPEETHTPEYDEEYNDVIQVQLESVMLEETENNTENIELPDIEDIYYGHVDMDRLINRRAIINAIQNDFEVNIEKIHTLRLLNRAIIYEVAYALACPDFRNGMRLEIRAVVEANLIASGVELSENISDDIIGDFDDAIEELQDELPGDFIKRIENKNNARSNDIRRLIIYSFLTPVYIIK